MPRVRNPTSGRFMANQPGMADAVFQMTFKQGGGNVLIDVLNKMEKVLDDVIRKTAKQGAEADRASKKTMQYAKAMQQLRTSGIRVVASMDRFIGATRRAVFVIGLFSGYITHRATRALQSLFRQFVQGTGYVIQMGATFERLKIQLRTVFREAGDASDAFGDLKDIAKRTPFQLTDVVEGAAALKAVGIDFRQTVAGGQNVLTLISDLAGAMGRSIPEAIFSFKEAVAEGSWRSLRRRFSITMSQIRMKLEEVAARAGSSFEEMFDFSTAQGRLEAISTFIKESFGGGSEAIAETLTGIRSNLQDSLEIFAEMVSSSGPMDKFKRQAQNVLETVDKLFATGALREWSSQIGSVMVGVQRQIQQFAKERLFKGISLDLGGKENVNKFIDNFVGAFGEILAHIRKMWDDNQSTIWKVGTEAIKLYATVWMNTFTQTLGLIWKQWWGKAIMIVWGVMRAWNLADALVGLIGSGGVFSSLRTIFQMWGQKLAPLFATSLLGKGAATKFVLEGEAAGAAAGTGFGKKFVAASRKWLTIGNLFRGLAIVGVGYFGWQLGEELGKKVVEGMEARQKKAMGAQDLLAANTGLIERMVREAEGGSERETQLLERRFGSVENAIKAAERARDFGRRLSEYSVSSKSRWGYGQMGMSARERFGDQLAEDFGMEGMGMFQTFNSHISEMAAQANRGLMGGGRVARELREYGDEVEYVAEQIGELGRVQGGSLFGWEGGKVKVIYDEMGRLTETGERFMEFMGDRAVTENVANLEDKLADMNDELEKAKDQERDLMAIRERQGAAFSEGDQARLTSVQKTRKEVEARMLAIEREINLMREQRDVFVESERVAAEALDHRNKARAAAAVLVEMEKTGLNYTQDQKETLEDLIQYHRQRESELKAELGLLRDNTREMKVQAGATAGTAQVFRDMTDEMQKQAVIVEQLRDGMVRFGRSVGNALTKIVDMKMAAKDLRAFIAQVWEGATDREAFEIQIGGKEDAKAALEGLLRDTEFQIEHMQNALEKARMDLEAATSPSGKARAKADIEAARANLDALEEKRLVIVERLANAMEDIVRDMGNRRQQLISEKEQLEEYVNDPRRELEKELRDRQEALIKKEEELRRAWGLDQQTDPIQYAIEKALSGDVSKIEQIQTALEALDMQEEAQALADAVARLAEINAELADMKAFDVGVKGMEKKIEILRNELIKSAEDDVQKQLKKLEEIRTELVKIREKLAAQQIQQTKDAALALFGASESQLRSMIEARRTGQPEGPRQLPPGGQAVIDIEAAIRNAFAEKPVLGTSQEVLNAAVKTLSQLLKDMPWSDALVKTAEILQRQYQIDESTKQKSKQVVRIYLHLMEDDKEQFVKSFDASADQEANFTATVGD